MTSGTVCPNGANSLAARLLASQGFKVIQIPYTEFDRSSTIVKRVQYLHQKLKDALLLSKVSESDRSSTDPIPNIPGEPLLVQFDATTTMQWKTGGKVPTAKTGEASRPKLTPDSSSIGLTTAAELDRSVASKKSKDIKPKNNTAAAGKGSETESSKTTSAGPRGKARVKLDVGTLFTKDFDENSVPQASTQAASTDNVKKSKKLRK